MDIDWGYALGAVVIIIASFILSLTFAVIVLIKLPHTYFLKCSVPPLWQAQHPAIRVALYIIKNLVGLCLVTAGVLLSFPGIPGQGILTILIGAMLLDFPGKRRWLRKLVSQPRVLVAVNRIRKRFGKLPLQLFEEF
jgi:hypothetical protein